MHILLSRAGNPADESGQVLDRPQAALALQPDLELDTRRTSPTVLSAFEAAREGRAAAATAPDDAGPPPDAGLE